MTMLTPITRAMTGPVAGTALSVPVTAVLPLRPVAEPQDPSGGDPGNDRPRDDRDRDAETTLRYKFDWLVQRQVRAGTIDADEAAEMIRLFGDTVAAPETEGDDQEEPAIPPRHDDAATALLDRLRDRFGSDGPYDDSGSQTPSTPAGMLVDERL
jgi:hypothetical protein